MFALLSFTSTTTAVPTLLCFGTSRNPTAVEAQEGLKRNSFFSSSDLKGVQSAARQGKIHCIDSVYIDGIEGKFLIENSANKEWIAAAKIPHDNIDWATVSAVPMHQQSWVKVHCNVFNHICHCVRMIN